MVVSTRARVIGRLRICYGLNTSFCFMRGTTKSRKLDLLRNESPARVDEVDQQRLRLEGTQQ